MWDSGFHETSTMKIQVYQLGVGPVNKIREDQANPLGLAF